MKVECNCGEEMELATYEPDSNTGAISIGFECPKCNASLYGTFAEGEEDED